MPLIFKWQSESDTCACDRKVNAASVHHKLPYYIEIIMPAEEYNTYFKRAQSLLSNKQTLKRF